MSPQPTLAQFHLVAVDPRDSSVHDNGLRVVVVGRSSGCDLNLQSHSVSELHACLVRRRDGVWLYDLGSRNGTSVNGRKSHAQRLNDGDNVQFGSHRFRIRISGQSGPAVATVQATLHDSVTDRAEVLSRPVTVVGRRERSDLHLTGDEISRIHCLLVRCSMGLIVHDMGSRNGTFVTGQRQKETLLTGDEILMIGPYEFRVEIGSVEGAAEPGPRGRTDEDDLWAAVAEETRMGSHPSDEAATGPTAGDEPAMPAPAAGPQAGTDDFDSLIARSLEQSPDGPPPEQALDDLFAEDRQDKTDKPTSDDKQ
ncbi:MAG: FHA domain-containing protein [Planctomycetes bacterium]|nr:FHA domain-containing protein [Planctomycetota bacterium]